MHTFLAVLVLVAIAFVALAVNILFFNKPFPETEIGKNKEMRKRGIKCAKSEEMLLHRKRMNIKNRLSSVTLDVEQLQK